MKKLFVPFAIMITLLMGCTTAIELEKELYHVGFDFTKYSKNNFLITPEGYTGGYESVGLITTIIYPEVRKMSITDLDKSWMKLGVVWSVKRIDPKEAIDSMYVQALNMGADALIRFNIKTISKPNGIYNIYGYEVSGFAIKRK